MASVATSVGALIVRPVVTPPAIRTTQHQTAAPGSITVAELCEHFLHHKRTMVSIGELCKRTIKQYEVASVALMSKLGGTVTVDDIVPDDFLTLRVFFAETRGPHALATCIQSVRTIFKYGYDCGLIDRPMRFGPGFKRPAAKLFRRARREGGIKMFEAAEIRAMIEAAQPRVRPMILLGINCGLGNTDCGKLEFSNLDLENGLLDYPRPKTESDRRAYMWPETVMAIKRAITMRNEPATASLRQTVFLTGRGHHWCHGEPSSSLAHEFEKIQMRSGVERRGRGFYCLRKTFRTIADEVGDQPAAMLVMGHIPPNTDMSAIYRQRISDDRLRIVADYVRGWLYPSDKDNFLEAYQRKAQEILKLWETRERLMAADVFQALGNLKMTQAELASYLGLNAQWISTLVRGREPISSDTELRLRAFIQDLANGKHPEPLAKKPSRPHFERATDVPLPDDVRTALSHHPLTHKDFRVFIEHLMELGITQRMLAEWWGYKWKFVNELAYGRHGDVPPRGANRLREVFGLPVVATDWTPPKIPKLGAIPAPPEIKALFDGRPFGQQQLRIVVDYLRTTYRFEICKLSLWLAFTKSHLSDVLRGRCKVSDGMMTRVRSLFAFAQTGGAE